MRRRVLFPAAIALVTIAGFVAVSLEVSGGALHRAAHPSWPLLVAAFVVAAVAQPLRAMAWQTTLRGPVEFKAVYAASAVGSFLDTVLPARLGEASKVGVLRVTAGKRWPGFSRAGGSLLCAHLLEAIAFLAVGAAAAAFLPLPDWARWTMVGGFAFAAGLIAVAAILHRRVGRFLPPSVDSFLASAAAPPRVLARAGLILLATWVVRWLGMALLLHALGVEVSLGAALVYVIVTGLANTAPVLPGNAGVYQGAAMGALALVGHAGAECARRRAGRARVCERRHGVRRARRARALRTAVRRDLAGSARSRVD